MVVEIGHRGPERPDGLLEWHYGLVDRCRAMGCYRSYMEKLTRPDDLWEWVPAQHRLRIVPGHPRQRPDWDAPRPDMCGAWRAKWNQTVPLTTPRCELPPQHVSPVGVFLGDAHLGRHPSGRWCSWYPFEQGPPPQRYT